MSKIQLERVRKVFDEFVAVENLDLTITDGEMIVFVGPSGCGKSTSLRLVAGLESASSGRIIVDGEDLTHVPPKERDMAMVFQNYALYPHMTVAENIGFALSLRGLSRAELADRVRRAAQMLDIEGLLNRRPKELSGGQRQRVAVCRAIVRDPKIFLFDEPLSNLDPQLRTTARGEIRGLQQRLGVTSIYVTHDQIEAMTMADRIVVMRGGKVQQVGTPVDIFERPANIFVAGFIGSPPMNILPAEAMGQGIGSGHQAEVMIGIRPEHLIFQSVTPGKPELRVTQVETIGTESLVHGEIGRARLTARVPRVSAPKIGETVGLSWPAHEMHLFDRSNALRLERN